MPSFRRRLFAGVSVLALILCLAMVGLWVRSYWVADAFSYSQSQWSVFMESGGGQFRFEHVQAMPERDYVGYSGFSHSTDRADGPIRLGQRMPGSRSHFDRWGFWIVTGERWGDYHYSAFVPAWFVLMLLLSAPAYWLLGPRRQLKRWRKLGRCERCGYDLRASPERCPECGMMRAG